MSAVRRIIVNTANAPSAIGPYNQVIIVLMNFFGSKKEYILKVIGIFKSPKGFGDF